MQDRLEEFIRTRRDEFDEYDLPEHIWKGAEQKLRHSPVGLGWARVAAIAASLIILIGAVGVYKMQQHRDRSVSTVALPSEPSGSTEEAEQYYGKVIAEKERELSVYNERFPDVCSDFNHEIDTLNRSYQSLKTECAHTACNDQVQQAIIQNLQTQLQLIQQQLQIVSDLCNNHGNINS